MAKKKKAKKAAKKKKIAEKKKGRAYTAISASAILETKAAKKKPAKRKVKKKPIGTCFVMMPFKEPFDMYYLSIFQPAIKAAGLKSVLASDLFRPSPIVADLWQMIQDSTVLLAELTTKNANVFYELGLAHAIGKPVILVSETMDDVPFDLQRLRILLYDKDDPAWGVELSQKITNALKETLVAPTEAIPGMFREKVESQAPKQDATTARLEALEQQFRSLRTQTTHLEKFPATIRKDAAVKRVKNFIRGSETISEFYDTARDLRSQGGTYREMLQVLNETGITFDTFVHDKLRIIFE
jgi:hypothetical protein